MIRRIWAISIQRALWNYPSKTLPWRKGDNELLHGNLRIYRVCRSLTLIQPSDFQVPESRSPKNSTARRQGWADIVPGCYGYGTRKLLTASLTLYMQCNDEKWSSPFLHGHRQADDYKGTLRPKPSKVKNLLVVKTLKSTEVAFRSVVENGTVHKSKTVRLPVAVEKRDFDRFPNGHYPKKYIHLFVGYFPPTPQNTRSVCIQKIQGVFNHRKQCSRPVFKEKADISIHGLSNFTLCHGEEKRF